MTKFKFTHKHPKVKETFKATVIDGLVFVSWADQKGTHMTEYTEQEAKNAIKIGDWIVQ